MATDKRPKRMPELISRLEADEFLDRFIMRIERGLQRIVASVRPEAVEHVREISADLLESIKAERVAEFGPSTTRPTDAAGKDKKR